MFIQNKHGEVVNVDQIIAIKFYNDAAPFTIYVFTERTQTIFEFDSQADLLAAMNTLEHHLWKAHMRWAECKAGCQNWKFRADKLLAINDEPCRNLTVSMTSRDFHVYTYAQDDEALMEIKKQLIASLSENFFESSKSVMVKLA
jgi:hypothetical protein